MGRIQGGGIGGMERQMLTARYNAERKLAMRVMKEAAAAAAAAKKLEQERARLELECRMRDALVAKHGLTLSEAEAVLSHYCHPRHPSSFPKDTLTALRAINGFAAKNGIRFEDAVTVLKEMV